MLSERWFMDKGARSSGDRQLTQSRMLSRRLIDAHTRYCGLFGHPVRHSASPAFQNAGMEALGLNWKYLALEVLPSFLPQALEGCKAMGFIGLNLTVPHKEQAARLADEVDEQARVLGSVNTLCFEGRSGEGEWIPMRDWDVLSAPEQVRCVGHNTDAEAITDALKAAFGFIPGQSSDAGRVLILGIGGAGRVAALQLASRGVGKLYLVNRTRQKAEAVAREIQRHYPGVSVVVDYPSEGEGVDLVLNATSHGLKPDAPLPYDGKRFSPREARFAFDMIYRPSRTRFLAVAEDAGCRIANGVEMLLYQGVASLKWWTGKSELPVEVMRAALLKNVYPNSINK